MARDDKKAKNKRELRKDKDIHLNVVGVPSKNVNVNKTKPIQNNEEYQLYRISIDTSGKEKERKHRIGSLEPSSNQKRIKNRKRYKSNDFTVLSSGSESDSPRPRRQKTSEGRKLKPSTPRAKKKGEVDSEICFTIPGEKGKAIKIVGSTTKPRNDGSVSSSKGKQSVSSGRQVEFAGLDEVYGTTPEGSSASYGSVPYERTSPQVYKMENTFQNSMFTDPTNNSPKAGPSGIRSSEDKLAKYFAKQRKVSPDEGTIPHNRVHHTESRNLDHERPSSSKSPDISEPLIPLRKEIDGFRGNPPSNYSRPDPLSVSRGIDTGSSMLPSTSHDGSKYSSSEIPAESKGKYPFYPYDKQKRSKPPTEDFHEHSNVKDKDANLGKSEPFSHQKLPSIPEVRSTEHAPGVSDNPEKDSVLKETTEKFHDFDEPSSPLDKNKDNAFTKFFPKPLKSQEDPYGKENAQPSENLNRNQKPINLKTTKVINGVHKSTSPLNLKTDTFEPTNRSPSVHSYNNNEMFGGKHLNVEKSKSSPPQDNLHSTPRNRQLESFDKNPLVNESMKSGQIQRSAQVNTSFSPVNSKVQESRINPVLNRDNTPTQTETTTKSKSNPQNKYEPRLIPRATPPLESSIYRLLKEGSPKGSPKFIKDSFETVKSNLSNKQVPLGKKTPNIDKIPETFSKEIMADIPKEAKEKIMMEIESELSNKPSPSKKKSSQDNGERKSPGSEKESKSKSRILTLISSIPKPMFRKHKSPTSQEKKNTTKSDQHTSTQPPESLPNRPYQSKDKSNIDKETRKPVVKSPLIKKDHAPKATSTQASESLPNRPYPPKDKSNIDNETRKPVVESSIIKKDHAPKVQAYPAWLTSPEPESHHSHLKVQPSSGALKSEATKLTASRSARRESKIGGATEPVGLTTKHYLPVGITDDSFSVEIANRSYGEHPLVRDTDTSPRGSKQITTSASSGEEEAQNNSGQDDVLKEIGSGSWKSLTDGKSKQRLHSDQNDMDNSKLPQGSGFEDGKQYNNFQGTNIVAYPGRVNEQTPFGYDSQFTRGPSDENHAFESLEDAYQGKQRRSKTQLYDSKLGPKTGEIMSPGSDGNKPDEMQPKPMFNSTIESLPSPYSSKEVGFVPGQHSSSKEETFKVDNRGNEPARGGGLGNFPVQNTVYLGQVPDKTVSVFHATETKEERHPSVKKDGFPLVEGHGPKGILIFVNKKNVTASPFQTNSGSSKKENNSTKDKNPEGPKKKRLSKDTTSSSGTTLTTASAQTSTTHSYAGGDKKAVIERSPSGKKTTQKYPCGCIRIIVSDPENQQKREDLISAYCRKGSQCDVRNQRKRKGEDLSSTHHQNSYGKSSRRASKVSSSRGRDPKSCPDIEVLADGVLSKKPIKPRAPAPTMNGADLTGTLNIKSNKFNGVYNFYLDRNLKKYLRNNMDKLKQLLEDDQRR